MFILEVLIGLTNTAESILRDDFYEIDELAYAISVYILYCDWVGTIWLIWWSTRGDG